MRKNLTILCLALSLSSFSRASGRSASYANMTVGGMAMHTESSLAPIVELEPASDSGGWLEAIDRFNDQLIGAGFGSDPSDREIMAPYFRSSPELLRQRTFRSKLMLPQEQDAVHRALDLMMAEVRARKADGPERKVTLPLISVLPYGQNRARDFDHQSVDSKLSLMRMAVLTLQDSLNAEYAMLEKMVNDEDVRGLSDYDDMGFKRIELLKNNAAWLPTPAQQTGIHDLYVRAQVLKAQAEVSEETRDWK